MRINVLILYEDVFTGIKAKKVYDKLAARLANVAIFEHQLWKFSVLADERFGLMAASEAAGADIVIIAARGDDDLPESVKSWLELWVDENHQPAAMVALFENVDHAGTICAQLNELANRGRLDFFSPLSTNGRLPINRIAGHFSGKRWPA